MAGALRAFDVSVLGGRPHTQVTEEQLDTRFVSITAQTRSFVTSPPRGKRPDGLVVCVALDGSLRHIGWYAGDRALEQLDLDVASEHASWRSGAWVRCTRAA